MTISPKSIIGWYLPVPAKRRPGHRDPPPPEVEPSPWAGHQPSQWKESQRRQEPHVARDRSQTKNALFQGLSPIGVGDRGRECLTAGAAWRFSRSHRAKSNSPSSREVIDLPIYMGGARRTKSMPVRHGQTWLPGRGALNQPWTGAPRADAASDHPASLSAIPVTLASRRAWYSDVNRSNVRHRIPRGFRRWSRSQPSRSRILSALRSRRSSRRSDCDAYASPWQCLHAKKLARYRIATRRPHPRTGHRNQFLVPPKWHGVLSIQTGYSTV